MYVVMELIPATIKNKVRKYVLSWQYSVKYVEPTDTLAIFSIADICEDFVINTRSYYIDERGRLRKDKNITVSKIRAAAAIY